MYCTEKSRHGASNFARSCQVTGLAKQLHAILHRTPLRRWRDGLDLQSRVVLQNAASR